MSKLKSLNEYDRNKGIHIVLGRHKKIPEGIDFGKNLVLMGDCSVGVKKRIEQAGQTCLHVPGCPPGEPLPAWMIVDRGEPPAADIAGVRKRQTEEDELFRDWLKRQANS